jgi:sugar/nucleoside kinase (ribokinase family)
MKQGELLAIGGAYIDINAPQFPLGVSGLSLETEVVGAEYLIEPGGSAVNFARLCASLEIPTAFMGKTGEDEMGALLSSMLAEQQVKPLLVTSKDVSTNVGFNMISGDDKSIMAVVGTANQALTPEEVYVTVSEELRSSSYLLLGGCFKLKKLVPAFVKLAKEAKSANVKVVLDHGCVNEGVTEEEKEVVRQLALIADFYLPSADEFNQLWGVSSTEEGLRKLATMADGTVVVKNSSEGAMTLIEGEMVTTPAFAINPIHTIGAGDSFNAGVIAAQYKGKTLSESIVFGCATAALRMSQPLLPTYDEVESFIDSPSKSKS